MDRFNKDTFVYYALILVPILIYLLLNYSISLFWGNSFNDSITEKTLTLLKIFWFAGILFVSLNLTGLFLFRSPLKQDYINLKLLKKEGWNNKNKLIISYVSYGKNILALKRSLQKTKKILDKFNVNYEIEVVVDLNIIDKLPEDNLIFKYVVPSNYKTKNNSKYKARALQYLMEKRKERLSTINSTWILHLDEESIITNYSLAGIHKFINNPNNKHCIGQGEIKYNAYNYDKKIIIAAVDSIRTGDDLGRFRLQFKLFNKPLFGMHGSYILTPVSIENKIGFDLGGKGSITEDAYFALFAADKGVKFDWVDGYIREQSPFTINDLIKQRRRWINGLVMLVFDNLISFKQRVLLLINMFLWIISWIGPSVAILNILIGGSYLPGQASYTAAFIAGAVSSVYMVGAYRNLIDSRLKKIKKGRFLLFNLLLVPVSSIIEGIAIIYAIVKPVNTFYVTEKNTSKNKTSEPLVININLMQRFLPNNYISNKLLLK